jgi:uncharacterized lipoprotein YmbA
MRRFIAISIILLFVIVPAMQTGCAHTEPARFYLLGSIQPKESGTEVNGGTSVAVGPIMLPEYLNRPQIVSQTGENMLEIAEFDRWAGPLEDSLTRILAQNISIILSPDGIAAHPWNKGPTGDLRVTVAIQRFERGVDGRVVLVAQWSVTDPKDPNGLAMTTSSYEKQPVDTGYAAMVAAQTRALADLSRDIARAIKGLARPG